MKVVRPPEQSPEQRHTWQTRPATRRRNERHQIRAGDYARAEVIDQGGVWGQDSHDDEHGRGLAVVAAIAGDGNWGIEGDDACRVAWFRLDWPKATSLPCLSTISAKAPDEAN